MFLVLCLSIIILFLIGRFFVVFLFVWFPLFFSVRFSLGFCVPFFSLLSAMGDEAGLGEAAADALRVCSERDSEGLRSRGIRQWSRY